MLTNSLAPVPEVDGGGSGSLLLPHLGPARLIPLGGRRGVRPRSTSPVADRGSANSSHRVLACLLSGGPPCQSSPLSTFHKKLRQEDLLPVATKHCLQVPLFYQCPFVLTSLCHVPASCQRAQSKNMTKGQLALAPPEGATSPLVNDCGRLVARAVDWRGLVHGHIGIQTAVHYEATRFQWSSDFY